jgi:Na+-transporting methylmalonyl-CoA/oxaloacetate decarboxylase gamma subunit
MSIGMVLVFLVGFFLIVAIVVKAWEKYERRK